MRLSLFVLLAASACAPPTNTGDGGSGGGRAGGGGSGGNAGPFVVLDLDANAKGLHPLAMAVDPTDSRVVVAYFTPRNTQTVTGLDDLNLNVVEWRDGVAQAPQTLRFVQRTPGLAVAIHPVTKEPTVAFLGGPDRNLPNAPSLFWIQHDASLSTRSGTTWTEVAARTAGDICMPPGSPMGSIVGLWPALRFDSTGRLTFVWRDVHLGANLTDYTGSDLESVEGSLGALSGRCVFAGFNDKPGIGARLMLAAGPGEESVLVYDQGVTSGDGTGNDAVLQRRTASGWTAPRTILTSSDTMTGPQVAWDRDEGYAVAVVRGNTIAYRRSADAMAWDAEEIVVAQASGGWYPSLAIDPTSHEPSVAFYDCSRSPNVTPSNCPATQDALLVVRKSGGRWQNPVTVDEEGGWAPKLGVLPSGKRVIAYRVPVTADGAARAGALKLAIER